MPKFGAPRDMSLNPPSISQLKRIVSEIEGDDEIARRAEAKKRHDIYKDGGKQFLIEQVRREFEESAIREMRFAPISLLKKMVNRRSRLYSKPPVRSTELESDQALMDFYSEALSIDTKMTKANRYFNLASNTTLYLMPKPGLMELSIVPSYLYSIIPNAVNRTEVDAWVFNSFVEEAEIFQENSVPAPATGREGYERNRTTIGKDDLIASEEWDLGDGRRFIYWSDGYHYTLDHKGMPLANPELGPEQFINPVGLAPVVNLAKDRDDEPWATQGQDLIDLTLAIQSGWSDLLTIAKHQGFSILTVISEEEPRKLTIGIDKAVWLKQREDGPVPSISYVQSSSPLGEYKDLLLDLLGLLLSTNDMSPGEISGRRDGRQFPSGFSQLIAMSDTLEAMESDKPFLRAAEIELWEKIGAWHNWMLDSQLLDNEPRSLGKFSEGFSMNIEYAETKPLESEEERIRKVKEMMELGLITRLDALKKLNPDMSDEAIEAKLADIQLERQDAIQSIFARESEDGDAEEQV